MSIFREYSKTKSDHNIHQNALNCPKFSRGGSISPVTSYHIRATIINMNFYMKIVIF